MAQFTIQVTAVAEEELSKFESVLNSIDSIEGKDVKVKNESEKNKEEKKFVGLPEATFFILYIGLPIATSIVANLIFEKIKTILSDDEIKSLSFNKETRTKVVILIEKTGLRIVIEKSHTEEINDCRK